MATEIRVKRGGGPGVSDPWTGVFQQLQALRTALANRCYGTAGLAIGTVASQVKIANTVPFTVNHEWGSRTTIDTAFTDVLHDIPASASEVREAVYLVTVDAALVVRLIMGAIAGGSGKATVPDAPVGQTAVGYVRVAVAAGATPFNASTDLLSAAHLTDTYVNLASDPVPAMVAL